MTVPRRMGGLGRGLGALIPSGPVDPPEDHSADGAGADGAGADGAGADGAGGDRAGGGGADGSSRDGASGDGTAAEPAGDELAGAPGRQDGPAAVPGARFAELPLEQIVANSAQPRTDFDEQALAELVDSIREVGLLQPVVVRETGPDRYELVMGERRWRASQAAGTGTIPAIIRQTGDDAMLRDALLENLHRQQLNPLEEAAAYQQLLQDFGSTHEELASRLGRSRPQVSNTLRLLQLPPAVQRRVAAGVLSAGHARAILGLPGGQAQDEMATRAVAEGMSVRSVEEAVQLAQRESDPEGPAPRPRPAAKPAPARLAEVADRLSDRLETRVKVDLGRAKGKVTIEFASLDDLERVLALIDPAPVDPAPLNEPG